MTLNIPITRLLLVALLFISHISLAISFEIISLRYQSAEQLIPILKPLLDQDSVITGTGYKLIVKTSPQQLEKIRQLVQQLDTPVQQLIISVSHDQNILKQRERKSLAGHIRNNHADIAIGQRRNQGGLTVKLKNNGSQIQANINQQKIQSQYNISQQVRILSGNSAFIQTSKYVLVPQQQLIINGRKTTVSRSVQYQDVSTGFYVTPRVVGNQVSLEISAHRQKLQSRRFGHIDQLQVSTSVQGLLGEWIELGTVEEITNSSQSGILSRQSRTATDSQHIFVKVDTAHNNITPALRRTLKEH